MHCFYTLITPTMFPSLVAIVDVDAYALEFCITSRTINYVPVTAGAYNRNIDKRLARN